MEQGCPTPQTIFAPAKVNLFLHVTDRKQDGYHHLQSLITFADFGDSIDIIPADNFSFSISGKTEHISNDGDNLVIKAAKRLSEELNTPLDMALHLSKKTPIGAGLGGGSADAAATIKGLLTYWNKTLPKERLEYILLGLGADVPVCYKNKSCFVEGVGEIITPLPNLPKLHAVLVYPNKCCSTAEIFKNHDLSFSKKIDIPKNFSDKKYFYEFLNQQTNDLTNSACQKISEIKDILNQLQQQDGCIIARMSGSGSTCFGIFDTAEKSKKATKIIQQENSNWWVRSALLG